MAQPQVCDHPACIPLALLTADGRIPLLVWDNAMSPGGQSRTAQLAFGWDTTRRPESSVFPSLPWLI